MSLHEVFVLVKIYVNVFSGIASLFHKEVYDTRIGMLKHIEQS